MNYKKTLLLALVLYLAGSPLRGQDDSPVEERPLTRSERRRQANQKKNSTSEPSASEAEAPETVSARQRRRLRNQKVATEPVNDQPVTQAPEPPKPVDKTVTPELVFPEHTAAPQFDSRNSELSPTELQSTTPAVAISVPEQELIELHFHEADLSNLVSQIETLFDYTFISDDAIEPNKGKAIKGHKISFKTTRPITKKEAWNLFTMFLDTAGFNVVPQSDPKIFRIVPFEKALRAPLPTFIDTDISQLPSSEEMIRYLYFIKNSTLESIQPLVEALRSNGTSQAVYLQENKAFVLIDKAYNVQSIMKIVLEFDKVCTPQSWSFLRLRRADAEKVKALYDKLMPPADNKQPGALFGARRAQTTSYFSDNTRIIAEPRTNSLIIFGTPDGIKKIERFIIKNIDVETEQPYSPLNIYRLKYADATTIADILNNMFAFGKDSAVGQSGGVRGEDRYNKPMTFIAETATNSVVIKGDYEGYLTAKTIIEELDTAQPQVAIEVLILSIAIDDVKQLGTQIRSKATGQGLFGTHAKFQTSGLAGSGTIVQNLAGPGVDRLLGNLLQLVGGLGAGNSVLTLGSDLFGVWGVVQALQTITDLQVISNPFLITTNRTLAVVSLGETRRVITSTIIQNSTNNTTSDGDLTAALTVEIVPQINADGLVVLDVVVTFNDFNNAVPTGALSDGNQNNRKVKTMATVADQEVLALGGLIRNRIVNSLSKVPILGDIPLIGWLFKNEQKEEIKEDLLILISSHIIEPENFEESKEFTDDHVAAYQNSLSEMALLGGTRDPIQRRFFDVNDTAVQYDERFIFERRQQQEARAAQAAKAMLARKKQEAKLVSPIDEPMPSTAPPNLSDGGKHAIRITSPELIQNSTSNNKLLRKERKQFSLAQNKTAMPAHGGGIRS